MAEVSRAEIMRLLLARMGEDLDEITVEASAAELELLLDIAREIGLQVRNVSPAGESGAGRYRLTLLRSGESREAVVRGVTPGPVSDRKRRHVNTFVANAGGETAVSGPLSLGLEYEVVCNIGRPDPRSLLASDPGTVFPDELLPCDAPILHVVLYVKGSRTAASAELRLPPGSEDSDWVRLALPPLSHQALLQAELAIYFEATVVFVQSLTIPVGDPATWGGPRAAVLFRLTESFDQLSELEPRRASILVADRADSPAILMNGISFAPNAVSVNENTVDTAARSVREQLYLAHFTPVPGGVMSRFSSSHGKSYGEFVEDLRVLANLGARLYDCLFDEAYATLSGLLRAEAAGRRRPPILQVVGLAEKTMPIPWALVYDLPVGGTPADYVTCPSIREFGPAALQVGDAPACCPYEQSHRDQADQLCPWGFWGLSAIVEHPPHVTGRDLEHVVGEGSQPLTVLVADDSGLAPEITHDHVESLTVSLGPAFWHPNITGREDLRRELAQEAMDVVYLYCHCDYDLASPSYGYDLRLRLGADAFTPSDINMWTRIPPWPRPHWPNRHPLVVINGCHTAEMVTGTLTSFVRSFANRAAAAGVVGTEITLEQGLAGWAGELFLTAMIKGATAGEALRTMRWAMFRRGNVMGLAYTPYCLAELSLRRFPQEVP